MQKSNPVDVIYVDFKKAFDKVPHKRLLNKLKAYGINGKLLNWVATLIFQGQKQYTVSGSKCTWTNVVTGVPQGSDLF